MKKTFEIIGLLGLACFSFFYTSKVSLVIKKADDIYIQIEEIKEQYKIDAIDAKIEGSTIIPGLKGSEIDIEASYQKMKEIGKFNDNLLVYKDTKPNISIENNYDKYVISGNNNKKQASLLFLVNQNDDITDTLNILEQYKIKATFYIDYNWLENNESIVEELIYKNHNIGSLDDKTNKFIKKNQEKTYCYSEKMDDTIKKCSNDKSYTIKPNIIVSNNPLIEIKKSLKNGSIISLSINNNVEKELPLIIEYINFKGIKLVNITTLLEE